MSKCATSLICRLKCLFSSFLPNFVSLDFLFFCLYLSYFSWFCCCRPLLSVFLCSLLYSSNPLIFASTPSSIPSNPLPPFLDTYILYHPSEFRPCASSSVFSFYGQFFLVPPLSVFKKGLGYLTKKTSRVFIPSNRFLLCCLLLFFWDTPFFFFFFFPKFVWWYPLLIFPGICTCDTAVLKWTF